MEEQKEDTDIIISMEQIEKNREERFTPKGFNVLKARLKSLVSIFNENDFPTRKLLLGFPTLDLFDSQECLARIIELTEILGIEFTLELNNENKDAKITLLGLI